MSTSFEFLSRSDRCPGKPVRSIALLLILVVGLGLQVWNLKTQISAEKARLESANEDLVRETAELAERAKKTAPPVEAISAVRKKIETHNQSLIGPRSSYARLFAMFEEWMPEGAVITQVESIRNGRPAPILLPEDRLFRLTVIFADFPTLSAFYRRLAQRKDLSGLFYQKKGRQDWMGRKGEAVEFTFRLEGK